MSSPKSNSRSKTADIALGQSQALFVGRSTVAGWKSSLLPQVPPPCNPRFPRSLTRLHRAGGGGRGRPFKGARGVVSRRGRGRGASARSREDDVPGRPATSSWNEHVGQRHFAVGANPGPSAAKAATCLRLPPACCHRLLCVCRPLPGPGAGL